MKGISPGTRRPVPSSNTPVILREYISAIAWQVARARALHKQGFERRWCSSVQVARQMLCMRYSISN